MRRLIEVANLDYRTIKNEPEIIRPDWKKVVDELKGNDKITDLPCK